MGIASLPAQTERILVLAPIGQDAKLTREILKGAQLRCEICAGLESLCSKLEEGVGVTILTEEALFQPGRERLFQILDNQPPWSTVPLVVLTCGRIADLVDLEILRALETRRGITFLERPVRTMTLVSTVQVALEDRRRQYQIRDLLQEAERGIRYRDEFLAMLGHELRNPLAPIHNALDILKLEPPAAASTLPWALQIIEGQVQQLTHLVDDLLDITRVTQGRIKLRQEIIGLRDIIAAAAETVKPLIKTYQHELIVSLPVRPIQVEVDKTRLTQVVVNLLQNAAKYTERGGHIWLTVRREHQEAVISVRDTGVGIPAKFLPQIFEPFSQAGRSLGRSQGGIGLGLALVQHLVAMHDGRVQAFSEGPGQGSEFIVRLPLLTTALQPTDTEPAPAASEARAFSQRILVVDDNQDVASTLARLLGAMGHTVHTTYDGEAALEAARTLPLEVIFLDIGLPGMDGYKVASYLRQEHGRRMKLIALTGYGQEEDRQRAYETGFDVHLTKPVNMNTLRMVLSD